MIVGAIVAVNSLGSTVNPQTGEFYADYLEVSGEFGNLKRPFASADGTQDDALAMATPELGKNTVICVVATNVKLTKAQAQKVAEMAQDGIARASPAVPHDVRRRHGVHAGHRAPGPGHAQAAGGLGEHRGQRDEDRRCGSGCAWRARSCTPC